MTVERMLELLILDLICASYWKDDSYADYLDKNYDIQKLGDRYDELGKEFLTPYALTKTKKLD